MALEDRLARGYQYYIQFKAGKCKDFNLLDLAVAKYKSAIETARSSDPELTVAIARAHMTECYLLELHKQQVTGTLTQYENIRFALYNICKSQHPVPFHVH